MLALIWLLTFRSKYTDKFADPDLVAADLIAQAEHDVNAQSILITNNKNNSFSKYIFETSTQKAPKKNCFAKLKILA